jgi:hypothetical protein
MTARKAEDSGAAPDGASDNAARRIRFVALAIGSAFLLLALAFVMMVVFIQDEARLQAVGPISAEPGAERGGVVFRGTVNIWEVSGRMTVDARRQVRFVFDLRGPTGQPAPASLDLAVALDMPAHEMSALRPALMPSGPGSFTAAATLPMRGQWRLRMEFPELTGVFLFDVDE